MASFNISEDVPETPHQPDSSFNFSKRSFGKATVVKRSFQHCWFQKWPFLQYKESSDVVLCHTCLRMFKEKTAKRLVISKLFFSSVHNGCGFTMGVVS